MSSTTKVALNNLIYETAANNEFWITGINIDATITCLDFEAFSSDYTFIIQTGALNNIDSLTSIILSSNVRTVEAFAFKDCFVVTNPVAFSFVDEHDIFTDT